MKNTAGFYKWDDGQLLYGTNVSGPEFELSTFGKDDHVYPTDGWYWFDAVEDAQSFFNISEPTDGRSVTSPRTQPLRLLSRG